MYPCTKDVLQRLLTLIEHNECRQAVKTWSNYRHNIAQACADCPYEDIDLKDDCCMCLESKLRTLSLYEHGKAPFEQELLNAVRKLDRFNQHAH